MQLIDLLLLLRLEIGVFNLPESRPFDKASLGSLSIGDSLYVIPVGVGVSEDIQRVYQAFKETVGGV